MRLATKGRTSYRVVWPPCGEAGPGVEHSERVATKLLQRLQSFVIYSPLLPVLRGSQEDAEPRSPLGLHGGGVLTELARAPGHERPNSPGRALETIREELPWLGGISLLGVGRTLAFHDRYIAPGRGTLLASEVSEGALFALFSILLAQLPSAPPFFAVENADHGLHPRFARELMSRFCAWILEAERRPQCLLTTQNPLSLDGLPLQDDRVRLFAVDRTANGRTVVKRVMVDPALLEKAAEGWTLSRLWTEGDLGGVPGV